MDISIVIVNYNSWKVLDNCLSSIFQLKTNLELEIIVVDNQSTNNQIQNFKSKYTTVNWIVNSGNNGFANACNLGALNAKANYIFFLNPDTKLQNGVLEHFISIYNNEKIGILTCLQSNNKGNFEKYNLLFPSPTRIFGVLRSVERKFKKKDFKTYFKETKQRSYPDWVSGSALFISKNNLEKIGYWTDDYWMYFEDVDLCKKAFNAGLKCVVTKEVSIFHLHGGASRINPKTKAITKTEVIKSRHTYISNHFTKKSQLLIHPILFATNILTIGILALISFPFFFIKKLKVNRFKFTELCKYYLSVFKNNTWLSERSMNFKK